MFFALSKILNFILTPSNAIAAIVGVGVVLAVVGQRRRGGQCVAAGMLLLLLVGFSPFANLLMLPLTERFPAWRASGPDPDGIIVLGGAIDPDISAARRAIELGSSAERILDMLRLAKKYPAAKIVFTGGTGNLTGGASEAPLAERLLREFGVDPGRIVIEDASRTTAENAVFTKRLLMPLPAQRWLVVTSAWHMPRAIGAFRAADFAVEAYPVDWRSRGWSDAAYPFRNLAGGLFAADTAAHEWLGLVAYRLTGRTTELLPRP